MTKAGLLVSLLFVLKVIQYVHDVMHTLMNDLKILALAVTERQVDFDLKKHGKGSNEP